jgi:hypothetical protein
MCDGLLPLWNIIEQPERQEFTNEDIDKLHILCNKLMCQWMDLLGTFHMTNYLHIIGSGHFTFFAVKYRNLYRYSQQGWKLLNQLLKHYYFNNTNHGDAAGNGGKSNAGQYTKEVISGYHCRPLMQLCQRSIMWKLGIGDQYFEDNGTSESNGNIHTVKDLVIVETDYEEQSNSAMYGIL